MTNIPSILIVSCSNTKPKSLIKLLTKVPDVKADAGNRGIVKQPWLIDTKYYHAEVNIFGLEYDFERDDSFNNNVEALIIHMDSNKQSGLEDLTKWEGVKNDCNLEVKLLVSNYCTDDTKISRSKALEWCLKRGFEFIELYPSINKTDEEDDFKEKIGVERIIEALQAHTWPNLVMKSKKKPNEAMSTEIKSAEAQVSGTEENFVHSNSDDFTELFSQLHMMKDSLQSMPMSQRKQCAEQMVTAFWKAIGGEEEEIFDL